MRSTIIGFEDLASEGTLTKGLSFNSTVPGPILEGMMFSELLNAIGASGHQVAMYHYRDKGQRKVDFAGEWRRSGGRHRYPSMMAIRH